MIDTALFFGSFNPIHNGHTAVARYVVERTDCTQLWFVVSPQNPLKPVGILAPERDRLRMTEIAVEEMGMKPGQMAVSGIEFELPKPSYTIDTLRELERRYPERRFSLLVGSDIMEEFEQWKEHDTLLERYRVMVYPRPGYMLGRYASRVTFLKDAPVWNYSSTDIRRLLKEGENVDGMVAPGIKQYIKKMGLWI